MGDGYGDARKLYEERGFSRRVGFGSSPAVAVVDLIVGFTDSASPLAGDLEATLHEALRIVQAARERDVPVFFTTVEYQADLTDAGLFPLKVQGLRLLTEGSRWVEVDPRLDRKANETLIKKKFASAFFGTEVDSMLRSLRCDTLIITGCTTSGCIRATAVDALQYGYRAIVPREAVGDRAPGPHEANLFDIDAKYGDVVSVPDVLEYLQRLPAAAERTSAAGPVPAQRGAGRDEP